MGFVAVIGGVGRGWGCLGWMVSWVMIVWVGYGFGIYVAWIHWRYI